MKGKGFNKEKLAQVKKGLMQKSNSNCHARCHYYANGSYGSKCEKRTR